MKESLCVKKQLQFNMAYVSTYQVFPFCVPDDVTHAVSRGEGSFNSATGLWAYTTGPSFPASVTLEEAFEFFRRVKTWKIDYNIALLGTFDDGLGWIADIEIAAISGSLLLTWTGHFTRTDERYLECFNTTIDETYSTFSGTASHVNAASITVIPDPPYNEDVNVSGSLRMFQELPGTKALKRNDTSYFPQFDVAFALRVPIPSAPVLGGEVLGTNSLDNASFSDITWSFNGGTFPAQISCIDAAPTCILTLVPHEWWEYDPGDGPVWNSSTGAQLRDPFSIQR